MDPQESAVGQHEPAEAQHGSEAPCDPEALDMLSPFGAVKEPLQHTGDAWLHASLAKAQAAHEAEGLRQQLRKATKANKELRAAVSAGVEAQRLQAEQAERAKDRAQEQHLLELATAHEACSQQVGTVKELQEQLLASGETIESIQAEVQGLQTLLDVAGEESLSLRANMVAADFAHAFQVKGLEEQLQKAGLATLELQVEIASADAARNKQVRALQHQLAEAGASAQVLLAGIAASDAARNLQVKSLRAQLEASAVGKEPPDLEDSSLQVREGVDVAAAAAAAAHPEQGGEGPRRAFVRSDSACQSQQQRQQPPRTSSAGSGSSNIEQAMARLTGEWQQPSVIPFESITWCKHPDGSLVELGSGAFSTVYRVLFDGVQPYAAKVLRLDESPEDFIKEASMLQQLRHRNIVQFAGVSIDEGRGILLTELCEGRDLRSRLGSLTKTGERLFSYYNRGKMVMFDTACALHYLHSHSISHFDIKASNVLLSRDGTAKLADVAFAKMMRSTQHSITEGRTGTWSYMAPELLLGQPCNELVDIYSWGVLLWEILTGEQPTRGCLRELRVPEECPQEVATMFLECIDNDPVNRPTARDLVQRLSQLLQRLRGE